MIVNNDVNLMNNDVTLWSRRVKLFENGYTVKFFEDLIWFKIKSRTNKDNNNKNIYFTNKPLLD